MSTPKLIRAVQHLLRQTVRLAGRAAQALPKILARWLFRNWLRVGRRTAAQAGFVLPTTILLLLVVTLTVGAIGYRTFTRSQQVIGERQQRVIYNAATPAIDRAKAKLEFLFDPDKGDKRGGGVPRDLQLMGMMLNDGRDLGGFKVDPLVTTPPGQDPYTLPQETRLDTNADGLKDNAWWYNADLDGDGVTTGTGDGKVYYSIVFTAPTDPAVLRSADVNGRAIAKPFPLVRNAPLSNATQTSNSCSLRNTADPASARLQVINGDGWFPDELNTTKLRKNFQVDAYVLPNNPNTTVATLEFQQDREATQGFKWAAWFRNDLEIFPGPAFNWNGAMHTEGSLMIGGGSFRSYMISSPFSCLYDEKGSEITATDIVAEPKLNRPKFQGQFITGTIRDNNYNGSVAVDVFTSAGSPPQTVTMTAGTDSIAPPGGSSPASYSLDPVRLQTDSVSVGRTIPDPATTRSGTWEKSTLQGRLVNAQEDVPYVDDTFRADNRWGPYPRWGRNPEPIPPGSFGRPITGAQAQELTGDDPAPGQASSSVGLDGYWERRARREGLRLIVGQRLELGDPAGWGGPNPTSAAPNQLESYEPLKPWNLCQSNDSGRCNEARQRRTLWDNLASVQATAVYHNTSPNGLDFPAACIATTVHPGTPGTLDKSATFEDLAYGLPDPAFTASASRPEPYHTQSRSLIISDFFRGRGTNGWEYQVPPPASFTNRSSNLMTVMRNLAQFAGDPSGGAPSFPPVQERGVVHPHPLMAMWGDFSNLRQIMALLDSGTTYEALSPADKTTLHTAGCLVGMLAYNVDYLEKLDYTKIGLPIDPATPIDPASPIGSLAATLKTLLDRNTAATLSKFPLGFQTEISGLNKIDTQGIQSVALDKAASNDPEIFIRLMERWRDYETPANRDKLQKDIYLAQLIITKEQVARDRKIGFGTGDDLFSDFPLGWCDNTNAAAPKGWRNIADTKSESTIVTSANSKPQAALSVLCSKRPRYPVLYALFPAKYNSASAPASLAAGYGGGFLKHGDTSASGEGGYVRDSADSNDPYIKRANPASVIYQVVKPELVASFPLGLPATVATITPPGGVAYPTLGSATLGTLPARPATAATGSTPNSNVEDRIKVCTLRPCSIPANPAPNNRIPQTGTLISVPFKDSALFNGREMMSVRVLNLNLDLLRQSPAWNGEPWLPKSGLVYAFREDAVSETHIVRPARNTWAACSTDNAIRTVATCQMNTTVAAIASTDPPLSDRLVSLKPVDYYADPDRRPHGFRLRNGASLQRANDNGRGMSFVTHNPAYVQGYFNLHRDTGSGSTDRAQGLEEFNELLDTNTFGNFYTRSTLNFNFAAKDKDQWRPTEILADAVTPLSGNFCDGSIEDGIVSAGISNLVSNRAATRYGCANSNNLTSYLDQNRPSALVTPVGAQTKKQVAWMRSNIADSWYEVLPDSVAAPNVAEGESPIVMYAGNPRKSDGNPYDGPYATFPSGKPLITADNQGVQMNMIMVSGLVPSRPNQPYGGLHNFPRFLENWGGIPLYISGAFLQLNFSTYATAPFDQDVWEVSTNPDGLGSEVIPYYSPPLRRWGYDVGLQYAPPGPVAERFKFTESIRSEFYSEPAADDPYIKRLQLCATNKNC